MIQKKISMLGSFAVGKTSLVRRFVHSQFDDKYLTTLGVKVDRKTVMIQETEVQLLLWDIHGEDEFQKVRQSYLRGSAGYLLVIDGTRPDTVAVAEQLHELAVAEVGHVPFVPIINKCDLREDWHLDSRRMNDLTDSGWRFEEASAKTGEGVESVFNQLTQQLLT